MKSNSFTGHDVPYQEGDSQVGYPVHTFIFIICEQFII